MKLSFPSLHHSFATQRRPVLRLVAATIVAVGLSASTVGAQGCLSGAETRAAIESGQVIPLASVRQAANSRGYNEVASASLCGSGGSMVWQVVGVNASGGSARLVINATSGAVMSER
ncbi:MAG: hypothetical protein AAF739_07480 [Pseudomonadota bacterium]